MTSSLFDLAGKVAVVSGAAQGMGQATALAVAQHGADVMLVDRNLAVPKQPQQTFADSAARRSSSRLRRLRARGDRRTVPPSRCRIRPRRFPRQHRRRRASCQAGRPDDRRSAPRAAKPRRRPLRHVPGSGPANAGARSRLDHEHRLARQHHGARPRPHRLQHGDGGRGADDARTEHRMVAIAACA